MRRFKIIVEKHPDGYVAYPLGIKGIIVGQGDTYEEALSDVKSAIQFHIEYSSKKLKPFPTYHGSIITPKKMDYHWQYLPFRRSFRLRYIVIR